jgi:hypothetical protein
MNVDVHEPREASGSSGTFYSSPSCTKVIAKAPSFAGTDPWKARLTPALARIRHFGHDERMTAATVLCREEPAHGIVVARKLLVGCMVALQHLAPGHGKGHAKGRRLQSAGVAATGTR